MSPDSLVSTFLFCRNFFCRNFRLPDRLALPGFLARLPGGRVLREKGIVGAELAAPEILRDRARGGFFDERVRGRFFLHEADRASAGGGVHGMEDQPAKCFPRAREESVISQKRDIRAFGSGKGIYRQELGAAFHLPSVRVADDRAGAGSKLRQSHLERFPVTPFFVRYG